MPWTIPDKGEAQNDIQSILFQEYLEVLAAGIAGSEFVLAGCACTPQGSPNMTVAVSKGSIMSGDLLSPVTAGNVTITTAHATLPRIDLIVADSAGAKGVRAGTAAAAPKPPARTAGDVVLAAVYVPAADTTISADQITDMRVLRSSQPVVLKKVTSPVTVNTTSTITTLFTLTLPDGLFLAGKQLRILIGGTYLSNSGTPTWTWTISYGGTTLFADATAATTADTDRGAWNMDLVLNAQANNAQQLGGTLSFQTPGGKTAPASGVGDLAVVTHVGAPIKGSAAVDSNSANRDLLIRVTHSVSNVAVETVMDFAVAELI